MDIGSLRHRITIQESTEVQSASGEPTQSWVKKLDSWASVRQLSGRELLEAQQATPGATHEVKMRYRDGITPKMRVLFGSRILNIEVANNIEDRNVELVLTCKENV